MFGRLCGIPPFQSKDEDSLYEIIKTVDVRQLYAEKAIWKNISDEGEYVNLKRISNLTDIYTFGGHFFAEDIFTELFFNI